MEVNGEAEPRKRTRSISADPAVKQEQTDSADEADRKRRKNTADSSPPEPKPSSRKQSQEDKKAADDASDDYHPNTMAEEELEMSIIRKMREYKSKVNREQGPYSDINLQELLNPMNRIDHIINRSGQRHAINNLQIEALLNASMEMIEGDHAFIKALNQLSIILHGDNKDWDAAISELADDAEFHQFREIILDVCNSYHVFVSKILDIRNQLVWVYVQKRDTLKSLKERYAYLEQVDGDPGELLFQ